MSNEFFAPPAANIIETGLIPVVAFAFFIVLVTLYPPPIIYLPFARSVAYGVTAFVNLAVLTDASHGQ